MTARKLKNLPWWPWHSVVDCTDKVFVGIERAKRCTLIPKHSYIWKTECEGTRVGVCQRPISRAVAALSPIAVDRHCIFEGPLTYF